MDHKFLEKADDILFKPDVQSSHNKNVFSSIHDRSEICDIK